MVPPTQEVKTGYIAKIKRSLAVNEGSKMATGAGKGNFGSKFRNLIGGKKKQKAKYGSTGSIGSGESDEEGYMDPEGLFSTEPPGQGKPPIPDYPPPSCPGSKNSPRMMRPYSSFEHNLSPNVGEMREHAKTLDSTSRKVKPAIADKPKTVPRQLADDYSDPWDSKSKTVASSRMAPPRPSHSERPQQTDNYMDPFDSKVSQKPVPSNKTFPGRDNYIEPWDTRTQPRNVKSKHKDDYKDPWDSEPSASLPKSSFEEDEDYNYTVPYDDAGKAAQKADSNGAMSPTDDTYDLPYEEEMAAARATVKHEEEKRKTNGIGDKKDAKPKSPVTEDNYDEPWEWKAKVKQAPPKPAHKAAAPQKSAPGGDDYDAPWEWSNNSLTKAMANLPPPTSEQASKTRERVDSSLANVAKPNQLNQAVVNQSSFEQPPESPKGYEVDPTIPLENQSWYHGKISRIEAERQLKGLPDCSYLIRDSESSKTDFSLSLRNNNDPMHLKISCRGGKFILGQHSRPYDSIPEMIHNYSMNPLNIRGAEKVKLIYPVVQEAMYFTVEPGT